MSRKKYNGRIFRNIIFKTLPEVINHCIKVYPLLKNLAILIQGKVFLQAKIMRDKIMRYKFWLHFEIREPSMYQFSNTCTLLCLIIVGGYISFFQIFHPQNHCIMTLPFYQNVKLGPTPHFINNTPY